jgi:hypothetical protein
MVETSSKHNPKTMLPSISRLPGCWQGLQTRKCQDTLFQFLEIERLFSKEKIFYINFVSKNRHFESFQIHLRSPLGARLSVEKNPQNRSRDRVSNFNSCWGKTAVNSAEFNYNQKLRIITRTDYNVRSSANLVAHLKLRQSRTKTFSAIQSLNYKTINKMVSDYLSNRFTPATLLAA